MGYLDDISLVGSLDTVASDVAQIINVGTEIGLLLNVDKCELIAHDDVVVNDAVLQSFNRVKIEDAILLCSASLSWSSTRQGVKQTLRRPCQSSWQTERH